MRYLPLVLLLAGCNSVPGPRTLWDWPVMPACIFLCFAQTSVVDSEGAKISGGSGAVQLNKPVSITDTFSPNATVLTDKKEGDK